jgi:hypothetical protein
MLSRQTYLRSPNDGPLHKKISTEVEDFDTVKFRVVPEEKCFLGEYKRLFFNLISPFVHLFNHLDRWDRKIPFFFAIFFFFLLFFFLFWLGLVNTKRSEIIELAKVGNDRTSTNAVLSR